MSILPNPDAYAARINPYNPGPGACRCPVSATAGRTLAVYRTRIFPPCPEILKGTPRTANPGEVCRSRKDLTAQLAAWQMGGPGLGPLSRCKGIFSLVRRSRPTGFRCEKKEEPGFAHQQQMPVIVYGIFNPAHLISSASSRNERPSTTMSRSTARPSEALSSAQARNESPAVRFCNASSIRGAASSFT